LSVSGSGGQGDPWHIESNAFGIVTSSTRPSSPFVGQSIYETDTKRYRTWDGTTWAMFAAGQFQACHVTSATNLSVPHSVITTVNFSAEWHDPYNWWVSGTPNRITPNIPVRFQATALTFWAAKADLLRVTTGFRLNGADFTPFQRSEENPGNVSVGGHQTSLTSMEFTMNGSTDYFDMFIYQTNTGATSHLCTMVQAMLEWKGL